MASEIRVDKINSLSGVGTVTLSPTGVDISGITTVQTLKVGTGLTASEDGDVFFTGVCTATTFAGSGANLTALPAANLSGTLPAISAANLTNVPAANITGTLPAISGANLTSLTAGNLSGALPAISAASLTSVPAANIVGVCTSGLTKTGGFGKVVQIKSQIYNTIATSTSATWADTGITITMTPTDSSNKLIFSGQIALGVEKDCSANFAVYIDSGSGFNVAEEARGPDRNSRTRATTGQGYFMSLDDEEYMIKEVPLHVILDADNTNSHTVKLMWNQPDTNARAIWLNRSHNDNNAVWIPSYTSHFTLMEVQMS